MRYILDTDHISLFQRKQPAILERISQIPPTERTVTIITVMEQVRGRLAMISRAKTEADVGRGLQRLQEAIAFFAAIRVLSYDEDAQVVFNQLRQQRIRSGTQDLRIAAIALRHGAILITRNQRDFDNVPNLLTEDWSQI